MFHSNTELLIDYWRGRRGERRLPARADIDPSGFAALAPRVFVAEREPGGDVRFRLAGEAILELYARQLRSESLIRLWRPEHRWRLMTLLRSSLVTAKPVVVIAEAWTKTAVPVRLEVLFAPLAGPDGAADLFLGLHQPAAGTPGKPLGELAIVEIREIPGFAQTSHLRLAAVDGRRIA